MKSQFLLLVLAAAAISSCSTVYKSGQTPDDVYYSPAKEAGEYVEIKQSNNNRYSNYEYDNADDRWLRMRVRNPYRWNAFDDYDWNTYSGWSNGWNNSYGSNWNSYWNGYYTWNNGYNPYCRNVIVLNPKTNPGAYNKVRNFSLNSYTNNNYSNSNTVVRNKSSMRLPGNTSTGSYNNSNSNSLGNSLRKVFSGSNSSYGNNNNNNSSGSSTDRSNRSYTPSTTTGSSSSGSSSSGSSSGGSSSGGSSSGRRGG